VNAKSNLFKPVFLKVNRSQFHINDIGLILKNSWDEKKIEFSCRIAEDKRGYEVYTNDFSYDNFLEELGIRVGEVAHHLRSALDNLIFSAARTICDPPAKPKKLFFPIFENEEDFYAKTTDVFNQIPESVKQLIVNVQPFSQRKQNNETSDDLHILTILQWLNNTDKHQTPSVSLAIVNEIGMDGSFEFDNEDFEHFIDEKNGFYEFFPVLPNSKVFQFRTTEVITKMNMKFNLNVEVCLEIFSTRAKLDFLQQIQDNILFLIVEFLEKLGLNIELRTKE